MVDTLQLSPARLEAAKRGVALVFAANGMAFASWASRTPAIKAGLSLDASQLGLLLICVSIGSLVALPLSGSLVQRLGPSRTVLAGAVSEATGFVIAAVGLWQVMVWPTAVGLVLAGVGIGIWDVAMNVEGADVERRLNRSIMSRFHAAWSFGSVAGAGVGAAAAALDVALATQLAVVAVLVVVLAVVGIAAFIPVQAEQHETEVRASLRDGWLNPRTLVIGLMTLAFAFTEGVANDWMAVAVVDGLGDSEARGAVGFGAFVTAMTLARLFGGSALDRWGRVPVLRAAAVLAAAGLLLVILGPTLPWLLVGALLWGAGAALGFPTGMSAAADDVPRAAIHVSVVSSIGYTAFLAGPPLVGFLADAVGIRHALYVVLVALVLALVTSASAKPLADSDP